MVKALKQTVSLPSSPHEVYEMLMDSKKHASFTGSKASISRKVGGKFTVWGGYAAGKNLQLVKDRKIVQSWRASDWPTRVFSRATFEFKPTKKGTKLTFTQIGIPDAFFKDIKQGWIDYYWKPMAKMLGGK